MPIQSPFEEFPTLRTPRLILRQQVPDDARALFALRSDPEVMRYIGRPLHKTVEDSANLLALIWEEYEKGNGISWAVTLPDDPTLVGTAGFWRMDRDASRAELGYMIAPHLQGKGMVTEACREILRFGFGPLGCRSVEARLDPANLRSVAVLERLGFAKEGHLRQNYFFEGNYTDTGIYGLLREEFFALNP